MKETDDKPMELLLRRHAQRNSAPSGSVSANGASAHLDADEINAIAENALPQAARARFTAHLADCDSCRKLVTALSMNASTASLIPGEGAAAKPGRSSFWEMLATVFALPLMRYGVPALTILLLVVAAFVTLRRGDRAEFVAQKDEREAATSDNRIVIAPSPESPTAGSNAKPASPAPFVEPGQLRPQPTAPAEVSKESNVLAEVPAKTGRAADVAGTFGKAGNYKGAANSQQPDFAPEPNAAPKDLFRNAPVAAAPAAPPPARTESGVTLHSVDEDSGRRDAEAQKKEQLAARQNRESGPSSSAKLKGIAIDGVENKGGPRRSRDQSEEQRGASQRSRSANETVQTRTVSGRTFRREGNIWVDTAYDSSRELTMLSLSSDKYQKLANDHAGLRTIMEQLGSVIVVWHGKQYRIH